MSLSFGAKRRPVLVLSGRDYHAGRREVIVAALTSKQTMIERSLGKMPARDLRAFQGLLRSVLGL